MPDWSWDGYVAELWSRGYEFWELRDSRKILRGYVLKKGNARYKASELGRGRNLMAGKLESTWKKLLGCFVVFLAVCIAQTVLVCHKLK